MKKQIFKQDAQKYIEAGLMDIIYESDDLCMCNVANTVYAIFDYTNTEYGHWGIMVHPQHVVPIANNNDLFIDLLRQYDDKNRKERSFFLNDRSFKIMQDLKAKTDINGPTKDIDLEMEEQLKAKNKSR